MNDLIRREDLENWLRTECYGTDTDDDKEYVIGRLREELPTVDLWHRVEEPPKEDGWYMLGFLSRWKNGSWWIPDYPYLWMTAKPPKEGCNAY